MASLLRLKLILTVFLLLESLVMCSSPVKADYEDNLLQRLNAYRSSLRLPALVENDNADCLADEIADQLERQPCPATKTARLQEAQFSNYPGALEHCHLNLNNTRGGAILLSCLPGRVGSFGVFNFTDPVYSRYLNDNKYVGAGVDKEDEWTVVVLTTNTRGGSFVVSAAAAAAAAAKFGLIFNLAALFLGSFVVLIDGVFV